MTTKRVEQILKAFLSETNGWKYESLNHSVWVFGKNNIKCSFTWNNHEFKFLRPL